MNIKELLQAKMIIKEKIEHFLNKELTPNERKLINGQFIVYVLIKNGVASFTNFFEGPENIEE